MRGAGRSPADDHGEHGQTRTGAHASGHLTRLLPSSLPQIGIDPRQSETYLPAYGKLETVRGKKKNFPSPVIARERYGKGK